MLSIKLKKQKTKHLKLKSEFKDTSPMTSPFKRNASKFLITFSLLSALSFFSYSLISCSPRDNASDKKMHNYQQTLRADSLIRDKSTVDSMNVVVKQFIMIFNLDKRKTEYEDSLMFSVPLETMEDSTSLDSLVSSKIDSFISTIASKLDSLANFPAKREIVLLIKTIFPEGEVFTKVIVFGLDTREEKSDKLRGFIRT